MQMRRPKAITLAGGAGICPGNGGRDLSGQLDASHIGTARHDRIATRNDANRPANASVQRSCMSHASNVGVMLEVEPQTRTMPSRPRDDAPFRIAVLADLGGRDDSTFQPRPLRIDRDDFDDVMQRIAPSVDTAAPRMRIRFRELDDFHPDHLYTRLSEFRDLRSLRARLDDPRTFDSAARELLNDDDEAGDADETPTPASGGSLLDRMIDEVAGPAPEPERTRTPPPADDFRAYIRSLVAPHVLPDEDPRKAGLVEHVDDAVGEIMRAILHDPRFAALEAAWRAVHMLVRRIDTGADLQVHVIDARRNDVEADLAAGGARLHAVFVEEVGTTPWSVIVSDLVFTDDEKDLALLAGITTIAREAGAPFIAAAAPSLAGCTSFATTPEATSLEPESAAWIDLRRSPDANWIGLVQPRLLMRQPYGRTSDECDTIEFEEVDGEPDHAGYLWGSGAFACALLLAESFTRSGGSMRPGRDQDIDGLPLHVYRIHHEAVAKPCAECWMTDRLAAALVARGLMPLASMKDRDAVRLVRFNSIASPEATIAGRWM
jgi:type VI secretion system protein ImpC